MQQHTLRKIEARLANDVLVDDLLLSLSVTVKAGRVLTLGAGVQVFDDTTTFFAGVGGAFAMARR